MALLVLVASWAAVLTGVPARAAGGDLDPGFGAGGTTLGAGGEARDAARQSDQKIVVAGNVLVSESPTNRDFRLTRYHPNGTLDTSFGSAGVVTTDFATGADYNSDRAQGVAVQTDGRIVAAGGTYTTSGNFDFALARYHTDGSLDAGFGSGGKVVTDFSSGSDEVVTVLLQGDGRVLAIGSTSAGSGSDFALARYHTDGSLDTGFGSGGRVTTDFGSGETAGGAVLQTDGKVVVIGQTGTFPSVDFALARYNADGTLDPTFDADGKVVTGVGSGFDAGTSVALQGDGRLVAAGRVRNGSDLDDMAVLRYSTAGALDATFDGDGKATVSFGSSTSSGAADVAVDANGVVAGGTAGNDFAVARLTGAGSLDNTFSADGRATTDFGGFDEIGALLLEADGKILAAGTAAPASGPRFALARYEATGATVAADLALAMSDDPDPVGVGEVLTYTVTASNGGPGSAYGVALSDTLASSVSLVSVTPSQGVCTTSSNTVSCDLRSLAPAGTATVAIAVTPLTKGTLSNTATVGTTSNDSNSSNNTATTTTSVVAAAGSWTSSGPLVTGRSHHTATLLQNGRVLVAGGVAANAALATAEVYNPATGAWTPAAPMPSARYRHSAVLLGDGRVLVTGGLGPVAGAPSLSDAVLYNPATNSWSTTAPMAAGHASHETTRLTSGKILLTGGIDLAAGSTCPADGVPNSAELYDPAANGGAGAWSAAGKLRSTRVRGHTVTRLADGKVLLVGGYMGTNFVATCGSTAQQNGPVELYDPVSNSWATAADTSVRRFAHTATLLPDGKVLVVGGNSCNGQCPTSSVELYDPAAGTWSARAALTTRRSSHTATLLLNGRVLVTGGSGDPGPGGGVPVLASAQIYNPSTNRWRSAGVLASARTSHTAVRLGDGRTLVAGGVDAAGAPVPISELYKLTGGVSDFDGDGDTDRAVYRSGAWYAEGQPTTFVGAAGDIPVPADYDGDGDAEHAVYRAGTWYADGASPAFFGVASDVPVPADYDGDGDAERAVYRPSVGGWFIEDQPTVFHGLSDDIPVPADYDGDGDADPAVYRPSVGGWYVVGQPTQFIGLSTDIPVPGDFNGDADTERAIWRPSVGGWYVEGAAAVFVGLNGDVPVPGDYDGDGDAERGIWRPNVGGWYVDGQPTVFLGLSGDIPLPLPQAVYRRFF